VTTVLVTGIGGSIGIDVARSLRRDASIHIVGCDSNAWGRRQAAALVDTTLALPRADRSPGEFADALARAIEASHADFAFVNPDAELAAVAAAGRALPCATALPPLETVGIALDKARTVAKAGAAAVFPRTVEVDGEDDVARCFETLRAPLWMRAAVGAGGRGSLTVETPEEACAWMGYWGRRGRAYRWVFQEFLPGANVNWTGLYARGRLVATAAMDRLRYFLGDAAASGVSGQVSQCATVDPGPLTGVSDAVVRALDAVPHGVYSVDLRADRDGRPLVTEVNPRLAGRPWLYTNAGVNLPLAAVRALRDQPVGDAVAPGGLVVGLHLHRQLDIEPVIGYPDAPGASA
jgi:carbamoyl-phosphate synthase large subunit